MEQDYKQLIKDIFDYLHQQPNDLTHIRIFIGNKEGDRQTTFEQMSNHLEIGVLANSTIVGYTLLKFLRFIIDKYDPNHVLWFFEKMGIKDAPIEKIVDEIKEEVCTDMYDPTYEMSKKLQCGLIVSKDPNDTDLWNFTRIKKEIFEMMDIPFEEKCEHCEDDVDEKN